MMTQNYRRNQAFFDVVFPDGFWPSLDRSRLAQDEQSMFGDPQVFDWLLRVVKPEFIIEIGSWKGHSANYMVKKCRELDLETACVCVDTFLGGPEHWLLPGMIETLHRDLGRPTILERFLGNTDASGNAGRIFPLTVDSFAGSEIFRHFAFEADLIFVDAGHDPISVRRDVMSYYPLLSESGVMFGDDYQFEPLAETVHECAQELGVQVLVSARKWIFANDALMKRITLPDMQMRSSYKGWVHP